MNGCIYGIIHNEKIYIGQTISLEERKKTHISSLINGYHNNKELQSDFDKEKNIEDFEFIKILNCPEPMLKIYEKIVIDYYDENTKFELYNSLENNCNKTSKFNLIMKMQNVFDDIKIQNIELQRINREYESTIKNKFNVIYVNKDCIKFNKDDIFKIHEILKFEGRLKEDSNLISQYYTYEMNRKCKDGLKEYYDIIKFNIIKRVHRYIKQTYKGIIDIKPFVIDIEECIKQINFVLEKNKKVSMEIKLKYFILNKQQNELKVIIKI